MASKRHDENRGKLCLVCFKKQTRCAKRPLLKILPGGKLEDMIKSHFKYNANDKRLPNAICEGCRKNLYRVKSGSLASVKSPNLKPFYDKKHHTGVLREKAKESTNNRCDCKLCEIVQTSLIQPAGDDKFVVHRCTIWRPLKSTVRKSNTTKRVCGECYGEIKRGSSHKCSKSSLIKNVKSIVQKGMVQNKVISSILKDKVKETNNKKLSITGAGGRPMTISVNSSTNSPAKAKVLSVKDIRNIQSNLGFSQRKTLSVASMFRVTSKNRKAIEPNLKEKLGTSLHLLDPFFTVKQFEFTKVKADKVTFSSQHAVICNDLHGLIEFIKENRRVSSVHLKFGIDSGAGSLKLTLSIQSIFNDSMTEKLRSKYNDGIVSKKFVDSGVKKIFIVGIAPNVQENYNNVSVMWTAININSVNSTFAVDLKLANIISGLMTHSSAHPCTYCHASKNRLEVPSEPRTIENIISNYYFWRAAGSQRSAAKKFMNCVELPLYTRDDTNTQILYIIPPPELHLLLGVVNTIFHHMQREYEDVALAWAGLCHVQRQITNGGTGFNGNGCKTLLKNVDMLRSICPIGCLKFVQVLTDFRLVVDSSFGNTLDPQYLTNISKFKDSYLALEVNVTPKVHSVFFHVEEFCSQKQQGLGFYCEQSVESTHFEFTKIWDKYNIFHDHPQYSRNLLKAVCEFNSLHI